MMATKSFQLTFTEIGNRTEIQFHNEFNEKGIIYRLTAVLFALNWNIVSAKAETSQDGKVYDVFLIEPIHSEKMSTQLEAMIAADLQKLFDREISVMQYLSDIPGKVKELYSYRPKSQTAKIELTDMPDGSCKLEIYTKDRPGLIFEVTQVLYLMYVDIMTFTAGGEKGDVYDTFLIRREDGQSLEPDTRKRIRDTLLKVV